MWGSAVEIERRNRIRVLLWAYAYEVKGVSLVSDSEFDTVASDINTEVRTGKWDEWFSKEFNPYTGMWIHNFPDLQGLEKLYQRINK